MTVLGFDPGLTTTGYGVVTRCEGRLVALAAGAIRTRVSADKASRLVQLKCEVTSLLDTYPVDAVALERLLFSSNQKTAIDVARASGAILLAVGEKNLPWAEYTPPEVKLALTGIGQADKRQVSYMVSQILGLTHMNYLPDATDALAVAICHIQRLRL